MTAEWISGYMRIEKNEIVDNEAKSHAKTLSNITTKETESLSNVEWLL